MNKTNKNNTSLFFVHVASFGEYNASDFRISWIYVHDINNESKWRILGNNKEWNEKKILLDFKNFLEKVFRENGKVIIWSDRIEWLGFEAILKRIESHRDLKNMKWSVWEVFLKDNKITTIRNVINTQYKTLINLTYIEIFEKNALQTENIILWEQEKWLHPVNRENFLKIHRSLRQKWRNFVEIYSKIQNNTFVYLTREKSKLWKIKELYENTQGIKDFCGFLWKVVLILIGKI